MSVAANIFDTKPDSFPKWFFVLFFVCGGCYPTTYSVPPVTLKPEKIAWRQWLEKEANKTLFEEENSTLFVGTWQIDNPYYGILFQPNNDGWTKTRLRILPDGTFILTDPPEYLANLQGFRGTLKGQWSIDVFHSWNLPLPLAINYETDEDKPSLHWMVLRTLCRDNTEKKHLRLFFGPVLDPDYPDHDGPAWKKVEDE